MRSERVISGLSGCYQLHVNKVIFTTAKICWVKGCHKVVIDHDGRLVGRADINVIGFNVSCAFRAD
jgi:hypothetical protein